MLHHAPMLGHILKKRGTRQRPVLSVAGDERIYAVGDIHGRCDLLLALLAQIESDARAQEDQRRTRLVFLGDYIDRGDQSARVLEALVGLRGEGAEGVTFLMGNHEAALLAFLADPDANPEWLRFGAQQTLASYGIALRSPEPDRVQRREIRDALLPALGPHLSFLRGLHSTYRSGDVVFAHAGLRAAKAGDAEDTDAVLWGYPGFLTEQPVPGVRVVHGHYDDGGAVSLPGRVCVDTGAYYSGVLTAVRLDDDEAFLSVGGADAR